MTAPHVGNTGINDEDAESSRIWVSGYVVRDPARRASSWRSTRTLADELERWGVVGISGVDTRALTRHLRDRGAMRVGVFSGAAAERPPDALLATVRAAPSMVGADLAGEVTHRPPVRRAGGRADARPRGRARPRDQGRDPAAPGRARDRDGRAAGVGDASRTSARSARPGSSSRTARATRPPPTTRSRSPARCSTTACRSSASASATRSSAGRSASARTSCGSATAGSTSRSPTSPPATSRSPRTTTASPSTCRSARRSPRRTAGSTVSHVGLNDGVVEGLRCLDVPAFSVQYHPEAAAGPHDSGHLFARFAERWTLRSRRCLGATTSRASW